MGWGGESEGLGWGQGGGGRRAGGAGGVANNQFVRQNTLMLNSHSTLGRGVTKNSPEALRAAVERPLGRYGENPGPE